MVLAVVHMLATRRGWPGLASMHDRGSLDAWTVQVAWNDVEADECDVGSTDTGTIDTPKALKCVRWEQWLGIAERGFRRSLILERLDPAMTIRRSPGPGPIRKAEWQHFGGKWLTNRNVIIHADGARSYAHSSAPIPGSGRMYTCCH